MPSNYPSSRYPSSRYPSSSRDRLRNFGPGGAVIGFGVLAVICISIISVVTIGVVQWYTVRSHVTVTVTDKERVCSGGENNTCKYLVYTDHTTLAVYDSFFAKGRQFDGRKMSRYASSDFYGAVRPCHKYDFVVYGKRWPFFSNYQNIVVADDIGPVDGCVER